MTTVRNIGQISLPTTAEVGQVLAYTGSGWAPADPSAGTGTVTQVNGVTPDVAGAVTLPKSAIGLGNVDNTSDANKPVSTAQAAAITAAIAGVTKSSLGLGNVDNTADIAKTFTASQISNSTSVGRSLLTAADAATARAAIGAPVLGTAAGTAADAGDVATALGNKADAATVSGFQNSKGAANGLAPLDSSSKVPGANLPAVDYAHAATNGTYTLRRDGSGNWPVRPTTRADLRFIWAGILPAPDGPTVGALIGDSYEQES